MFGAARTSSPPAETERSALPSCIVALLLERVVLLRDIVASLIGRVALSSDMVASLVGGVGLLMRGVALILTDHPRCVARRARQLLSPPCLSQSSAGSMPSQTHRFRQLLSPRLLSAPHPRCLSRFSCFVD